MYTDYKNAEETLQVRLRPLGYTVKIEPITGTDLFYSDGALVGYWGKISIQSPQAEWTVYFPDFLCYTSLPSNLSELLQLWKKEFS
jgi:hypothetical protein